MYRCRAWILAVNREPNRRAPRGTWPTFWARSGNVGRVTARLGDAVQRPRRVVMPLAS
jgi:hypothetical protein